MKIDLSQFRQTFLQESADHVAAMESGLLALQSAPPDGETLNAIFRAAHSIKGGAGTFGLEALVRFTHALESLLDRLRAAEIQVTEPIVEMLLDAVDELRALLDPESGRDLPPSALAIIQRIEALTAAEPAVEPAEKAAPPAEPGPDAPVAVYRIDFHPDRDLFSSGTNPLVLLRNLASLGTVSVSQLHAEALPSLAELDPGQCYLAWTVEIATARPAEELREVFEFVEHLADIRMQRLDAQPCDCPGADPGPDTSAVRGSAAAETGDQSAPRTGTGKELPANSRPAAAAGFSAESSSIRVSTEKVDRLIDLVGELVIAHVMTAQMVDRFDPACLPRLRESVAAMERNTRELHQRVMAIRMLPVGTLFQRYVRTVHDIAHATGKQIQLSMSGEETEIDKSMLELLGDPLTHLIRNAADHGIETPEVRTAAGKPAEGTISLRAFHRSGRVVLEVADDGAGIDPARVRAKAIKCGLITAAAQLSDNQLRMLIFEPGFSTCDRVSDFSGRGVGMDVVRQNVKKLNGSIALTSETGRGSTVTIELPLTLAIVEGLLVRVADRTLVLPLLSVVETVSPAPGQIQRVAEKGAVVLIRDEAVPLLSLHRFLGLARLGDAATETNVPSQPKLVVVVEAGRRKIGLIVDELLDQQQVVVKSLERHLHKVNGLMGATILGDGCVAPILDVAALAGMNLFSVDPSPASGSFADGSAVISNSISLLPAERGESAHAMV